MIKRKLENIIWQKVKKGKAILILGARQTGKTTLIKEIAEKSQIETLYLNADLPVIQQQLQNPGVSELKQLIGKAKLVFIDEAQRIQDIGITLKIIVDEIPEIQLVVTGSSSFELTSYLNEPLTGRKY